VVAAYKSEGWRKNRKKGGGHLTRLKETRAPLVMGKEKIIDLSAFVATREGSRASSWRNRRMSKDALSGFKRGDPPSWVECTKTGVGHT